MKATMLGMLLLGLATASTAADWQWSSPDGESRAYLWIPPNCQHLRGVVVCSHNMIEQGILEHPTMRKTLTKLGFAEVWEVPYLDHIFDFNKGAGEHFQRVMDSLADVSGYTELKSVPVVPLGHSACATYPWNFAAWNPHRTLALVSIHGDAPQTKLTGYGGPNVDWGDRNVDGVPALMIMGEYEWWEDRLTPLFTYKAKHPNSPIAFLADAGHGHFDFNDSMISFVTMFIQKAAEKRLSTDGTYNLKPIDPKDGWRIDRWHRDQLPNAPAAPYAKYTGDPSMALWCFDGDMARRTEQFYAAARGKKPQMLGLLDGGKVLAGQPVEPRPTFMDDGVSYTLHPIFLDKVEGTGENPPKWANLPMGTPLGHATGGGPIIMSKIVGPVKQTGPYSFAISPDRTIYTMHRRNNEMWLLLSHPGDREYKSTVQQFQVKTVINTQGKPQTIAFPAIPDQKLGTKTVSLHAASDAGLPVSYYVLEGPAEMEGNAVRLTSIPPKAKFPVKVTIVAWQWGRGSGQKVQTATPVERSFFVVK